MEVCCDFFFFKQKGGKDYPKNLLIWLIQIYHFLHLKLVKQSWDSPIQGNELYVLAEKLRRLKSALIVWNRVQFGNIHNEEGACEEEVRKQRLS